MSCKVPQKYLLQKEMLIIQQKYQIITQFNSFKSAWNINFIKNVQFMFRTSYLEMEEKKLETLGVWTSKTVWHRL